MTPSIRRGVEFGDEGYYLQLLLDLEKNGFANSPFRTPHQLAALVQLPLLKIFRYLSDDIDGLVLYLRSCYQLLSLLAALLLYLALAKAFNRPAAMAGSLLVCAFIPHYLPTLSYNSLVMCAFVIAFTSQLLSLNSPQRLTRYIFALISCVAWIVGSLSYPTFSVVAALNFLFVLAKGRSNPRIMPISLLIFSSSAVTALWLFKIIEFSWFSDAFNYQRAVAAGYGAKGNTGVQLDFMNPLVIAPIGLLVFSAFLVKPLIKTLTVTAAILVALTSNASPNLPRTHLVIAILGLGFAIQSVLKKRSALMRLDSMEYVLPLSLTFSLVLASSSGGASMNLALAMIMPAGIQLSKWFGGPYRLERLGLQLTAVSIFGLIFYWSFVNHYGDSLVIQTRVHAGAYGGLTTSLENALLLEEYQEFFQQHSLIGSTITYVGVNSGLLVDSDLELLQLSPWPIEREAIEHAKISTQYMDDLNPKPSVVVLDSHWYINPFGYQFFCLYQLEDSQKLSNGNTLEIWRFNDSLPVCPS